MTDADLRELLLAGDADAPDSPGARSEDRAWAAVLEAYRSTAPRRPPRPSRKITRRRLRWRVAAPVLACLLAVTAGAMAAVRTPRGSLASWLGHAVGLSAAPAQRPLLAGLPGGGRLLVESPGGPWLVSATGHRHYLGPYSAAAWSPHGLYVVVWRGDGLAALDPSGATEWTLAAAGQVLVARWSPDGYRIAYVAGPSLWIVAGDGSGRHLVRARVAPVVPAWEPNAGSAHRIALVEGDDQIELLDADSGARLWRTAAAPGARQLLWSPDGSRLLVVGAHRLSLLNARGRLLVTRALPAGEVVRQAAPAHSGDRVALIVSDAAQATNSVALLDDTLSGLRGAAQTVFSVREPLAGISWSPGDDWLLTANPDADQWIFIGAGTPTRLEAVSRIAGQFRTAGGAGFPTLGGWQAGAGG
jgi:hypothetical protein